jgi:hypothetical protein
MELYFSTTITSILDVDRLAIQMLASLAVAPVVTDSISPSFGDGFIFTNTTLWL